MTIMTQLEFQLDFTQSEKMIAAYILDNGDSVLSMSIHDLAKATYTSPATIVRLTKKLGLDGYNDFKIKYSAELQYSSQTKDRVNVNFPFGKDDSLPNVAYQLSSLYEEVVKDTIKLIDYKYIEKVITLIDNAKYLDVYGNGNSMLAALSFQHKMMRIGRLVNLRNIEGEQTFMALNSNSEHLAVVISYSGETDEMLRITRILKQRGTPMIVITSIGDNHISHYGDYILNVGSREKIFSKIAPFSSTLSIDFLLNFIYSGLFQRHYDDYLEKKINIDKRFDHRHPKSSPVSED